MNNDLDTLIKALQILRKYGNPPYPIQCEQDVMFIDTTRLQPVSEKDLATLAGYGFFIHPAAADIIFSSRFGAF